MSKKTALYDDHIKAGGKMVEFAGWEMPVQYEGLKQEHLNTRENIGLFDVSHMGEIRVTGEKALQTLEWLTTNSVAKLQKGQAQYSLLPNENGGLIDDVIVYCLEPNQEYLVCVNASNAQKDYSWMCQHNQGAEIEDISGSLSQIAVQGPKAISLCERVMDINLSDTKNFAFKQCNFKGGDCIVARTGYTGEDGCEIFVPNEQASQLWNELLLQGKDDNAKPVGLGARDTLRLEARLSLYGNEINEEINPYAAGLGWTIKANDKDFIGKQVMLKQKEEGLKQKIIGYKALERGIPRQGYKAFSFDNEEIGWVTSGTLSPSLNESIGLAYLNSDLAELDNEFLIEIRNKKIKAKVVKTPFVQRG